MGWDFLMVSAFFEGRLNGLKSVSFIVLLSVWYMYEKKVTTAYK